MYIEINKFGLSRSVDQPPIMILGIGNVNDIPHHEIQKQYGAKYQGFSTNYRDDAKLYYVYMYLTSKNYYVCPEAKLARFVDVI